MSSTFLDTIVAKTRRRVGASRAMDSMSGLIERAHLARELSQIRSFRAALDTSGRVNVIAEIKRASPSRGVINSEINVPDVVAAYEAGGAVAISVLTEPEYFSGALDDLFLARQLTELPLLRKDFIIDEYQVYEAAAFGADAILLIVAALEPDRLAGLMSLAENELQMDVLVEVHSMDELSTAARLGCRTIGVNNRNLKTLSVSLDVSRQLIDQRPEGAVMVAESGITTADEISELRSLGYDAFLIGESIMRNLASGNPLEGLI